MSTAPTSFGRRRTRRTGSNCRALALGLAISTLGAGTLALTVPTLASATPSGCSDVLAVMTPGTWETTSDADPRVPVGMLAAVGNSLKTKYDNKVELFYTPYAASAFDQGKTYGDSKTTAIDAINDKVSTVAAKCPRRNSSSPATPKARMPPETSPPPSETGRVRSAPTRFSPSVCLRTPAEELKVNPSSAHPPPGPESQTPAPTEWARSQDESRRSATPKTSTAPSTKATTVFSERSEPS